MKTKISNKKGFTLVEVLLVVVIIAILAAIVIVAINPGRQISQSNNTQRNSDVRTILNAVQEYSIDNRGALPAGIPDEAAAGTATVVGSGVGQIDICDDLVPTYIAEMPYDPTATGADFVDCTDYDSGYTILLNTDDRIEVTAPDAELSETISVTQ